MRLNVLGFWSRFLAAAVHAGQEPSTFIAVSASRSEALTFFQL